MFGFAKPLRARAPVSHWVVVLSVLWLAAPAAAQELPELAIVGLHLPGVSDEVASEGVGLVERLATRTERVRVVAPVDVAKRLAGREALVLETFLLSQGRRYLDDGRGLYERAAPQEALPYLEKAVVALEEAIAAGAENRYLVESLLLLGQAHAASGARPDALMAFERVVQIDALFQLDAVNYPPKTVQLFEDARVRALEVGIGSIAVDTAEPGASVWLDGRAVGRTPVTVEGVVAGERQLVVQGANGRRTMETVRVSPDQRADVRADLDQWVLAGAAKGLKARAQQTQRLYRSLGEHLQADLVLIGGTTPDGPLRMQLYVPRTDRLSKSVSAHSGDDPYAAAARILPQLLDFVRANGDLDADRVSARALPLRVDANPVLTRLLLDPEPPTPTVVIEETLVSNEWMLWTGAGVLGAAGVVGLSVALLSGDGEDSGKYRGTIEVGPMP